jgi:hypothetical protein
MTDGTGFVTDLYHLIGGKTMKELTAAMLSYL